MFSTGKLGKTRGGRGENVPGYFAIYRAVADGVEDVALVSGTYSAGGAAGEYPVGGTISLHHMGLRYLHLGRRVLLVITRCDGAPRDRLCLSQREDNCQGADKEGIWTHGGRIKIIDGFQNGIDGLALRLR